MLEMADNRVSLWPGAPSEHPARSHLADSPIGQGPPSKHPACSHLADPPVGREDDDGRQGALQRAVKKCEAFNVEHVHLVHKQNTRDQLCDALVDVPRTKADGLMAHEAPTNRDLLSYST